ncbi:putative exodeoxyribonuclease V alpha subunit [Mycobacterium xenopi 4042]|uniref:Putative exodeoxyribonuclease V alpha subunit n=1 Tax=Mycobacterium xenopi 4042 TaxID=1299334 RepID=X8C7X6_MYCXE|nr:putative exodeoxyribonuclease V alpha subunit [Mycobacterium xenopi 4042]
MLADLVDGLSARTDVEVAALRTSHRFGESIGALADAIRVGDAERAVALLRSGDEHLEFVEDPDPTQRLRTILVPHALRLREAATLGAADQALAILGEHRLLCAHRDGPRGVRYWNRQVETWLAEETGMPTWSDWYAGRPLLVTANDYGLRVYNGDTGSRWRPGWVEGRDLGCERTAGLCDQSARRRRNHARDDHPQIPGQPG